MKGKTIDFEQVSVASALKQLLGNFCIGFTVIILLSMVLGSIFADEEAKAAIGICWSVVAVMAAAAILQYVFFTPVVIRRMGYGLRIGLFGMLLYGVIAAAAVLFGWFPREYVSAWMSFTIIYLVIFGIMTVLFTLLYRREVKALNEGLARFKARR